MDRCRFGAQRAAFEGDLRCAPEAASLLVDGGWTANLRRNRQSRSGGTRWYELAVYEPGGLLNQAAAVGVLQPTR